MPDNAIFRRSARNAGTIGPDSPHYGCSVEPARSEVQSHGDRTEQQSVSALHPLDLQRGRRRRADRRQLLERFAGRGRCGRAGLRGAGRASRADGPAGLPRVLARPNDAQDAFQATFLVLVRKARCSGSVIRSGRGSIRVAFRPAAHARGPRPRGGGPRSRGRRTTRSRRTGEPPTSEARDPRGGRPPARAVTGAPVVLCDLEGLTHEEAARQLGWPVGTVKSRLARGRERLPRPAKPWSGTGLRGRWPLRLATTPPGRAAYFSNLSSPPTVRMAVLSFAANTPRPNDLRADAHRDYKEFFPSHVADPIADSREASLCYLSRHGSSPRPAWRCIPERWRGGLSQKARRPVAPGWASCEAAGRAAADAR